MINDVVLIHHDNAPRHLRRIGRVIELIISKSDNEVKGASVKVPRTGRTVQRPTNKLIPIKCIESLLQINGMERLRSVSAPLQRSRRNAATVGELRRRLEGQ